MTLFSVILITLIISTGHIWASELVWEANVCLREEEEADVLVAKLVQDLLESQYDHCSLAIDTDMDQLSPDVQRVFRTQQTTYHPSLVGHLDPVTFHPKAEDYPEIWKEDQLFSFLSLPHSFKSQLWLGMRCTFSLLLPTGPSAYPHLVIHAASLYRLRNLHDPVFTHLSSSSIRPERILLEDPGQGIAYQALSHPASGNGTLTLHNTCFFCDAGEHVLNPPIQYTGEGFDLKRVFLPLPNNMNGKKVRVCHVEEIDMVAVRKKPEEQLQPDEASALYGERRINVEMTFVVPQLVEEETYPNGSITGLTGAIMYKKCFLTFVSFFTPRNYQVNAIFFPVIYIHTSFATRIPRPDLKWYVMVQPYTVVSWTGITVTVVVFGITFCMLSRQRGSQIFLRYVRQVLRHLIEQPEDPERVVGVAVRTVYITLLLFCMVINCCYRSKLVALITSPELEYLPESAIALINSKMSAKTTLFTKVLIHMAVEKMENQSEYQLFRKLVDKLDISKNTHTCLSDTLTEDSACVLFDYMYEKERELFVDGNGNLQLLWAPDRKHGAYTGPAVGRDSVIFEKGNKILMRAFESSMMNVRRSRIIHYKFLKTYYRERKRKKKHESDSPEAFAMDKMKSFFFFWITGLVISVVIFAFELARWGKKIHDLLQH